MIASWVLTESRQEPLSRLAVVPWILPLTLTLRLFSRRFPWDSQGDNTFSRPARRSFLLLDIGVPEAFHDVIIYHSYRLHERVADSWADKPETSPAQLLAHPVRLSSRRWNLTEHVELVPNWS